jgi:hypothetical protein
MSDRVPLPPALFEDAKALVRSCLLRFGQHPDEETVERAARKIVMALPESVRRHAR